MKKINGLLIVLLGIFAFITPVFAAKKTTTTVPTTTVPIVISPSDIAPAPVEETISPFQAGNIVDVDKNINDTAFIAGNIITANTKINGIGFIAGNTITRSGDSDYEFIAGNTITIKDLNTKDIFASGSVISIKDSTFRNLYAAGAQITVEGDASKIIVAGDKVILKGNFDEVVVTTAEFELEGTISGKLTINDTCNAKYDGDKIGKIEIYESKTEKIDPIALSTSITVAAIIVKIISAIIGYIALIIAGFVFIGVCKRSVKAVEESNNGFGYIAARFGIGFAVLVLAPLPIILLLISGIGTLLGAIALILYILLMAVSSIYSTLYFSKLMFKKMNNYGRFALTALILGVIKIIPILGTIVSFLLFLTGMGIAINTFRASQKEK